MLTIQAEDGFPLDQLPDLAAWDVRSYGRNMLLFYVVSRESSPAVQNDENSTHPVRPFMTKYTVPRG